MESQSFLHVKVSSSFSPKTVCNASNIHIEFLWLFISFDDGCQFYRVLETFIAKPSMWRRILRNVSAKHHTVNKGRGRGRQTDKQTDRQTDRQTNKDRQTETGTEKEA